MCEANSTYCKEKKFTVFYPGNLQGNQSHIDLGFNGNITLYPKNRMEGCGFDLDVSNNRPIVHSCEHGYELLC
jgi:hypothetical protein